MIEVKEVATHRQLMEFIKFPYKLYSANHCWVPPLMIDEVNTLKKDRNPAFEYCEAKYWLAYRNGKIAGRIAGIINRRYMKKWGFKYARFGWIDFDDDFEVCKALLDKVEDWARSEGMEGVHGPLGFCDLDKEGLLIEGFDKPGTFITIYNYPYYPEYIEKCGYVKDADWIELKIQVPERVPGKLEKIAESAMKNLKLQVVEAKKPRDVLPYVAGVFRLLNEAYKDLYGVVELTDRQVKAYAKQYLGYIDPDYISIILDESGEVAAFGISMPSLSDAMRKAGGKLLPFGFMHILKALYKNDSLDLYLVAVKPEFENKGVSAVILTEITKSTIKKGFKTAQTAPMLETNRNVQGLWDYYDTELFKKRRCYIKHLG